MSGPGTPASAPVLPNDTQEENVRRSAAQLKGTR